MISRSSITLYPNPGKPIGIHATYFLQVQKTLERILLMEDRPTSEEFPLTFKIADCLDGSGCHTIYNQQTTNTFSKNFILFCLKPISIHTVTNRIVWQNKSPNSPFSQRPIFLCAATECEENIRSFMECRINPDTAMLQNGITLENGVVNVDIIRSMFDGKMTAILSGAGGASGQMCTATHKDLKDRELVLEGFCHALTGPGATTGPGPVMADYNWSALAITGPAIRRSLTGSLFSYLALEPEWTMGYGSRLCDP